MRTVILLFLAGCLDSNDGSTDTMGSGGTCDMAAERAARAERCQDPDMTVSELEACCAAAGLDDCTDQIFAMDMGRTVECSRAYCEAYTTSAISAANYCYPDGAHCQ